MNKEYFKYLIHSKKGLLVFLGLLNFVFPTLLYFVFLLNNGDNSNIAHYFIGGSSILLFIESIALPILYFSFIQNKRSVDVYFALPIAKEELYFTTFLVSIVEIVVLHVLAIIPIVISEAFYANCTINIAYLLLYIILTTIACACINMFTSAIIMKCNSVFDSIMITSAYIAIPLFIALLIDTYFRTMLIGLSEYDIIYSILQFIFLPMSFVLSLFNYAGYIFEYFNIQPEVFALGRGFVIILILGIISLISFLHDIKKRKSEQAEQLSTNLFTYPFIISFVTCSFLLLILLYQPDLPETIILVMVIFIIYSIMGFVYKRKIKLSKRALLLFLVALVASFGFVKVSEYSNGFNLSHLYKMSSTISRYHESHLLLIDEYYYNVEINTNNPYHMNLYGADTYDHLKIEDKEFIEYVQEKQRRKVEEEVENNKYYYAYDVFSSLSIVYNDGARYYYTTGYNYNKEYYDLVIKDLRFFQNYDFMNISITKELKESNDYKYEEITVEEFINFINSL